LMSGPHAVRFDTRKYIDSPSKYTNIPSSY
jgi:hypothetical protein